MSQKETPHKMLMERINIFNFVHTVNLILKSKPFCEIFRFSHILELCLKASRCYLGQDSLNYNKTFNVEL